MQPDRNLALGFQLLRIDRQRSDPFAGCWVDSVADRRRRRRHTRFADLARQMSVLDKIDVGLRRDVDARDEVIGVVALLDAPAFHCDLAIERIADAHDRGARQLRAHAVGVNDRAAIDRHIEPWYRDLAIIADSDMRDDSHIAQKVRWTAIPRPCLGGSFSPQLLFAATRSTTARSRPVSIGYWSAMLGRAGQPRNSDSRRGRRAFGRPPR